jgi:transcription antitermination factor NusG
MTIHALGIPADVTEQPWYAVQVRTKYEKKVADALTGKGYECLLPIYRERRNWSDRTKVLELPVFPGYVFSRFDVEVRLPILTTPGVISVAGLGKIPQPLDEFEIEQIRRVTQLGYPALPAEYMKIGQKVRVTAGPLTGIVGILHERRGETRVVLSLTKLEKSMSIQVDADAIRAI